MKQSVKAGMIVSPQPVFIIGTYNEDGVPNAMNVIWSGICEQGQVVLPVSGKHQTIANVKTSGAFTVSLADAAHMAACDYVGIVSGRDTADKMEKAGFHTTKSDVVNAPLIDELPLALECRLVSYDEATCRLVGEIVRVSAEESVLTEDGKVDLEKLCPLMIDPSTYAYLEMGKKIGQAFQSGAALQ